MGDRSAATTMSFAGLTIPAIGALLLGNILLLWWMTTGRRPQSAERRTTSALALCWLAIALNGLHNFEHRSTDQVVSSLTTQTAIELALVGVVGVYAVYLLRGGLPVPPMGASFGLLPLWIIASAAWANAPAYAVARGAELTGIWLLGLATAGVCVTRVGDATLLFRRVARGFIFSTVALIVLGVLLGPLFVQESADNVSRFTWIAAHPVNAGYLLGFCMIILLTSRSDALGVGRWTHLALVAVFGAAIYANETRTVVIAVVAGALAMLVRGIRRRPDMATLGMLTMIIGGVAGAGAVGSYVLRGGDTSELWTLNGRTDLWSVAYDNLHGISDWALGLGYGESRVLFVDQFSFATNAHNSLLSALVDVGWIGAALLVLVTFGTLGKAIRSYREDPDSIAVTLVALAGYLVVVGATSDLLMTPGLGTVGIYLVAALSTSMTSTRLADRRQGPAEHVAAVTSGAGDQPVADSTAST